MQESDISRVLRARLKAMPDVPPILYENQDKPETMARPYLAVQMVRVSRRNTTINGSGGVMARGFMQVTVVADLDQFSGPAETIADNIAAHFPKALRLTDDTGAVTVLDAPNIMQAMRDESDWRVSVQIDYWAS
jgi:hypothetical protein